MQWNDVQVKQIVNISTTKHMQKALKAVNKIHAYFAHFEIYFVFSFCKIFVFFSTNFYVIILLAYICGCAIFFFATRQEHKVFS